MYICTYILYETGFLDFFCKTVFHFSACCCCCLYIFISSLCCCRLVGRRFYFFFTPCVCVGVCDFDSIAFETGFSKYTWHIHEPTLTLIYIHIHAIHTYTVCLGLSFNFSVFFFLNWTSVIATFHYQHNQPTNP